MIFEEVVLHNFGVYRGRHAVSLEVSEARPIVLVGAMNGAGKTTFLDAMQLALYGKSARCTGRERISYNDYLASMINRDMSPSQGAGIEFAFRSRSNGQDSNVRIKRTWSLQGQKVKENFEVIRDDVLDVIASERWQEFVEDFMPSQIADLFFFDGEKIEALADPQRSASLLRVGVHSLLGIDLVESLIKGLQQVERKRKISDAGVADQNALEVLRTQRTDFENRRSTIVEQIASLRTHGDQFDQQIKSTIVKFKRIGGQLYENRDKLEHERSQLANRKLELEGYLRELASGVLPLGVVSKLLQDAVSRASESYSARELSLLRREIVLRDRDLIRGLSKLVANRVVVSKFSEQLKVDRRVRFANKANNVVYPDGMVDQYRPEQIKSSRAQVSKLLSGLADTKERLATVEANLSAVPDKAGVLAVQADLTKLRAEKTKIIVQIELLMTELGECDRKIAGLTLQLDKESDRIRAESLSNETAERVIAHSFRARQSLADFRERLLQQNLERLQIAITTCFRRLLRKHSLVSSVNINPETFQLSAIHPGGSIVPAHRLSAGERQLLAIATLWALSQAAGRHLPAVIDTPLSRLDSRHRGTIVKNYFPFASHQVILLSTDEEVVGRYYAMLEPHIGRQYLIEHDEERHTSLFKDGYFEKLNEVVAEVA